MDPALDSARDRVVEALQEAASGLVGRADLVDRIGLAAVAREHLLVVGPPGTGKSLAARRAAATLGGRCFEYLLGRFTEPSELFGPVDLRRLREGELVTRTEGMLPEAELAFLDEVFRGSTAILNALLTLLQERRFRRGHTVLASPLRVCLGATNTLPTDPELAAFADRFLVQVHTEPVDDAHLEDLLAAGWSLDDRPLDAVASMSDVDRLAEAARSMDLTAVRPALAQAVRALREAGIALGDRRVVRTQRLVAASAALAGREVPDLPDLWTLVVAVPGAEAASLAREVLDEVLDAPEQPGVARAADGVVGRPESAVDRWLTEARALLTARGRDGRWRTAVQDALRELDAAVAPEARSSRLTEAREALIRGLDAS